MKIPLVYPKIPDTTGCMLKNCIVFEKLDGTNIHFTIRKGKWTSYGTRRDDFNTLKNNGAEGEAEFIKAHPELDGVLNGNPYDLITLDEIIEASEKLSNAEELILFMEYEGDSSFAGQHKRDEDHNLTLFDAQIDGRMMPPEELIKEFGESSLPKILYKGKYSGQLVEDIRNGKYPVAEGAVIKGEIDGQVYMAKVKTNAYMKRLKESFKDKWQDYWE